MNIQLKRGLIDICVLAVLKNEESYGYKIISDLKEIMTLSESTLYPVLKRLESQGCLVTSKREYNGRLRKYYGITDVGVQKIQEFMEEWKEMEVIGNFIRKGEKL